MNGTDVLLVAAAHRPGDCHGVNDPYVERFWLPAIGPASYLMWRLLATEVTPGPTAIVEVNDLAVRLGLGSPNGTQSGVARTLKRLGRFGVITWPEPLAVEVRPQLPELHDSALRHLAPRLVTEHTRWQHPAGGAPSATRPTTVDHHRSSVSNPGPASSITHPGVGAR